MKKSILKTLVFCMMFMAVSCLSVSNAKAADDYEDVKNTIITGMDNVQTSINISAYKLDKTTFKSIMQEICSDNVSLFYITGGYSYGTKSGKVVYVKPKYAYSASTIKTMKEQFEAKTAEIVSMVDDSMTDLEKALVVYDYIVTNVEYDFDYGFNSSRAYGPLVEGKGTCYGYANSYLYIMRDVLGFDCRVVISDDNDHSWNVIKIGDNYYNCDTCWADPVYDILGNVLHDYFMISDSRIASLNGYTWKSDVSCTSTKYDNYFWKDVKSIITKYNGSWYYINKSSYLCKADIESGQTSVVANIQSLSGGTTYQTTKASYTRIAIVNGTMYVNSSKYVYKVNFGNTVSITKVASPRIGTKKIYGITNIDGVLYYQYKSSAYGEYGTTVAVSL